MDPMLFSLQLFGLRNSNPTVNRTDFSPRSPKREAEGRVPKDYWEGDHSALTKFLIKLKILNTLK
eukprot:6529318-Pyramimonas_sp.AAC.1